MAWILEDHGVQYWWRFVEPLHSRRNIVRKLTGYRTVPAIIDVSTGVTMVESDNIVEYV